MCDGLKYHYLFLIFLLFRICACCEQGVVTTFYLMKQPCTPLSVILYQLAKHLADSKTWRAFIVMDLAFVVHAITHEQPQSITFKP